MPIRRHQPVSAATNKMTVKPDRKEFLGYLLALTSSLFATPTLAKESDCGVEPTGSKPVPRRKFGATGKELPVLGLGGYHMGIPVHEKVGRQMIDVAIEEGVRFFDNAESYHEGKSEQWMGAALTGMRKEVFLMTKTYAFPQRTAESAKKHLEGSLDRLKTDYLDLWQLHSVRTAEDVDNAFRAGGAMEYILDAKKNGLVRYVGVTGHTSVQANQRALKYFDDGWHFDTFQFPCNPIDFHQHSFQHDFLPRVVQRGIAVLAMKTAAAGSLVSRHICDIDECLRFVLSLPVSIIISGMESVANLRHNADVVRRLGPFTAAECETLLTRIKPNASPDLEPYKESTQ